MADLGYLQVTRHCNQKCRFCSNPDREIEVDFDAGAAYIDRLKRDGYIGVIFTGGEPTLSEHLPRFFEYCRKKQFISKLITNAQKISDPDYLEMLLHSGLDHVCISFHSHKPEVQNYLTQNPDSHSNIIRALENLSKYNGLHVDILTTINRLNAGHLSENVRYLLQRFPFIAHFSWNNLDPSGNRTVEHPDVVSELHHFEYELKLAMDFLHKNKKPFQVERVPLCYMGGYEYLSTETRTLVLDNKRISYFLDERGCMIWEDYKHGKGEACKICSLETICAGLYEMDVCYSSDELYPLFIDKRLVIKRIRRTSSEMILHGAPVSKKKGLKEK